jgi:hypothetical protein
VSIGFTKSCLKSAVAYELELARSSAMSGFPIDAMNHRRVALKGIRMLRKIGVNTIPKVKEAV